MCIQFSDSIQSYSVYIVYSFLEKYSVFPFYSVADYSIPCLTVCSFWLCQLHWHSLHSTFICSYIPTILSVHFIHSFDDVHSDTIHSVHSFILMFYSDSVLPFIHFYHSFYLFCSWCSGVFYHSTVLFLPISTWWSTCSLLQVTYRFCSTILMFIHSFYCSVHSHSSPTVLFIRIRYDWYSVMMLFHSFWYSIRCWYILHCSVIHFCRFSILKLIFRYSILFPIQYSIHSNLWWWLFSPVFYSVMKCIQCCQCSFILFSIYPVVYFILPFCSILMLIHSVHSVPVDIFIYSFIPILLFYSIRVSFILNPDIILMMTLFPREYSGHCLSLSMMRPYIVSTYHYKWYTSVH